MRDARVRVRAPITRILGGAGMLSGQAIAFRGGHSLLCDSDARLRGASRT
jgi:hypothetical protein